MKEQTDLYSDDSDFDQIVQHTRMTTRTQIITRTKDKWAASWQNQQNDMYTQRKLRSAWAPAQSDQSLHNALNGYLRTHCFFMRTANTLIRLGGSAQTDLILRWARRSFFILTFILIFFVMRTKSAIISWAGSNAYWNPNSPYVAPIDWSLISNTRTNLHIVLSSLHSKRPVVHSRWPRDTFFNDR